MKRTFCTLILGLVALGASFSSVSAAAAAPVLPPVRSDVLFAAGASSTTDGSVIQKIDANGNSTILVPAISFSPNSTLLFDPSIGKLVAVNNTEVWHIDPVTGEKTQLSFLPSPGIANAAAVDTSGNLFVAMADGRGGGRIIKVDPQGTAVDIVTLPGASSRDRQTNPSERGLAFDLNGNLTVLINDGTLYRVDSGNNLNVIATIPHAFSGGVFRGIAYDRASNLFISESFDIDGAVQKLATTGTTTVVAQSTGECPITGDANFNYGIAFDAAGILYAAHLTNHCGPGAVVKINPNNGVATSFASGLHPVTAALAFEVSTAPTFRLSGFYSPVDMPTPTGPVFNTVKGGSTVPLKFEVFAAEEELTDPAVVRSLTYAAISCDASAPTDEIETLAAGGTSLRYDTTVGQFVYNWKTPKRTGCLRLTLTTQDDSTLVAYFKLR